MSHRVVRITRGPLGLKAIHDHLNKLAIGARDVGGYHHLFGMFSGFGGAFALLPFYSELPMPQVIGATLVGVGTIALLDVVRLSRSAAPMRATVDDIRKRYLELTTYTTRDTNPTYDIELDDIIDAINILPIPNHLVSNGNVEPITLQFLPPITE